MRNAFVLLFTAAALALPAFAQRDVQPRRDVPTITVGGNGEARVDPDEASVRLGVTRQADHARAAQEQVNAVATKILSAVTGLGIERNQIQTSQLTLTPIYSQPKPGTDEEPRIIAYRASNVVTVRVQKLDSVGAVIDAGLGGGANQVEGVSFDLRNDLPARQQALQQAVREAREKARTIAETLDVKLGSIQDVQEGGVSIRPPVAMTEGFALRAAAVSTPVSPGQVTVSASVTLRYRIQE
jgi:uncharacterized protein YggE